MTIRVAIVGFGKIARDEHLPAILANPNFELAAIVTSNASKDTACPQFRTVADMFAAMPGLTLMKAMPRLVSKLVSWLPRSNVRTGSNEPFRMKFSEARVCARAFAL